MGDCNDSGSKTLKFFLQVSDADNFLNKEVGSCDSGFTVMVLLRVCRQAVDLLLVAVESGFSRECIICL